MTLVAAAAMRCAHIDHGTKVHVLLAQTLPKSQLSIQKGPRSYMGPPGVVEMPRVAPCKLPWVRRSGDPRCPRPPFFAANFTYNSSLSTQMCSRSSRSAVHGEFSTGGPKSQNLGGAPGLLELVQGASLHPKRPMQGFGEHLADTGVGPPPLTYLY